MSNADLFETSRWKDLQVCCGTLLKDPKVVREGANSLEVPRRRREFMLSSQSMLSGFCGVWAEFEERIVRRRMIIYSPVFFPSSLLIQGVKKRPKGNIFRKLVVV